MLKTRSLAPFPLSLDLHVDFQRCILLRDNEELLLTGREVRLLRLLSSNPFHYFTLVSVAEGIISSLDYGEVSDPERCVWETVQSLHYKFGEAVYLRGIIRSRGNAELALFPQVPLAGTVASLN